VFGKGVLCSREFSAVGRTVATDSEWRWASTGGLGMEEGQAEKIRFWPGALKAFEPPCRSPLFQGCKSGVTTMSNKWRAVPGWHTSSASSGEIATASGTDKRRVSKICTQQPASPFQNLMRLVFWCLTMGVGQLSASIAELWFGLMRLPRVTQTFTMLRPDLVAVRPSSPFLLLNHCGTCSLLRLPLVHVSPLPLYLFASTSENTIPPYKWPPLALTSSHPLMR
jgi:hypothetical protein